MEILLGAVVKVTVEMVMSAMELRPNQINNHGGFFLDRLANLTTNKLIDCLKRHPDKIKAFSLPFQRRRKKVLKWKSPPLEFAVLSLLTENDHSKVEVFP